MQIKPELARKYDEDGVVVLRRFLSEAQSGWLGEVSDAVTSAPPPLRSPAGSSLGYTFLWLYSNEFRRALRKTPLAAAAAQMMGAIRVRLFYDQVLTKEPGESHRTPWHQDLPYWPVSGAQILSFWVALDPVCRDNGAVEYVRGSHRWNRVFKPTSHNDGGYWADTPFEDMPDIEAMRGDLEILSWDMRPGDAIVHHPLTVHGAYGNHSTHKRRRAYITRWFGDDVRYAPRNKTMELPIDLDLAPGAPLDIDLFPLCCGAS